MSALLVSVFASGCQKQPPKDLVATIVGYRELMLRDDGRHLVFDTKHPPSLVIYRPNGVRELSSLSIQWRATDGSQATFVPESRQSRNDVTVVRYLLDSAPPSPGPGQFFIARRPVSDQHTSTLHWSELPKSSEPYVACSRRMQDLPSTLAARRRAVEWLRCAELAQEARSTSEVSRRKRAAAFHLRRAGRPDLSNAVLEDAEVLDREASNHLGLARNAYYRGWNHLDLGDLRSAGQEITRGLELARRMGFERDADYLTNLRIRQLREEGRHREALRTALEVEEAFTRQADQIGVAHAQNNRAWVMVHGMERGLLDADYDAAARLLERAQITFENAGEMYHAAMASANRAWIHWRIGEAAAADRILGSLSVLSDWTELSRFVNLLRAELALEQDKHGVALSTFQGVVEASEDKSLQDDIRWLAHVGLGRTLLSRGQLGLAKKEIRRGIELLFRLGYRTAVQDTRASFFDSRRLALSKAGRDLIERGVMDTAFVVAAAMVAAPYRGLAIRASRLTRAPSDWNQRLSDYLKARRKLAELRDREAFVKDSQRATWREQLSGAKGLVSESFERLYTTAETHTPTEAISGFPSTREVASQLAADEAIVVAAPDAEGVDDSRFIFIGPRGVTFRDSAVVGALGAVRHVYVIAGKPTVATSIRPLLNRSEVSVSFLPDPSLLLRPASSKSGKQHVVVADPNGDLPFARREGRVVGEAIDADVRLFGSDATRETVLDSLSKASVFHFAGHGELHRNDAWRSHLRLARGDRLTVGDILLASVDASLVVLSGCDTGRTTPVSPRVSFGLAEAFLLAGAQTVIASLEPVNDRDTEKMIARFYQADGMSRPAETMQKLIQAHAPRFVVYGHRGQ